MKQITLNIAVSEVDGDYIPKIELKNDLIENKQEMIDELKSSFDIMINNFEEADSDSVKGYTLG